MNTQQRIESLFAKMVRLQHVEPQEPTLFSIGSRGYYEKPTTDVLAFFLDDTAPHELGPLVLEAFVDCLPKEFHKIDCSLSSSPEREVVTKSGKRIDLLLENQQWTMVIENKVFHKQNNPFNDYENFVLKRKDKRFDEKKPIFVVLSPSGQVPPKHPNWVGVSYTSLISAIKKKLSDYFISQPLNKWIILLREFTLHLENMMSKPTVSNDSIYFVLDNLAEIKQVQNLKDKAIKSYQKSLHQALQVELETDLNSTIVHWHGYPAIRFAYAEWPTDSDVVLFLDARDGKSFCINYYVSDIHNDSEREVADSHFQESDCGEPWNEVKGTYRCYKARFVDTKSDALNLKAIQIKLTHKLKLMNDFERTVRPSKK